MSIRITIRGAIVAVGILTSAGVMNTVAAAPLVPATISIASTDFSVATPVRWRGHGGGGAGLAAGLMTGLIIGGLVAAPHYYEGPYPYYYPYYYPGYYAPRYVGPIGYGAPGWEALLLFTLSFVRSDQWNISGLRWYVALLSIVGSGRQGARAEARYSHADPH